MTSPFAALGDLPTQVRQLRESLTNQLRGLDPDSAAFVESQRAAAADTPSVVIVGETNRGKSSLVNAVLAVPGLSPVDADVTTATYLRFTHAAQWSAQACYPGGLAPVDIAFPELVRWVARGYEPPEGRIPPRYVNVSGPVPLLERVCVVDTPGVGGLDSAHGELALEAAADATALLFVVDASAPFTAGELRFLAKVAERVETVLFALTKTDQFRGWREILDADQRLLAEHAPRFAGARFHPVSPRMFELAAGAPNEAAATMLRERSGIIELQTKMQEVLVGKAAMLDEANALRALSSLLGEQYALLQGECRALSSGAAEVAQLRARREELRTQRRSSTKGWQVRLRGEIQSARVDLSHAAGRQTRQAQAHFRGRIDAARREDLTELPAQVDAALQTVSRRISMTLAQRLNHVTGIVLAELFSGEELDLVRAQLARTGRPPVALRSPERRPPTAEDKLLVFMGVSGGVGAGKLAAMPLAGAAGLTLLSPVVLPATIVLGLGAGWWMARTRRHAADKQHMKQWLVEAIADARSTLEQLVAEQLIQAEQQLSLALDEALERRIEGIEAELAEVDKSIQMDTRQRQRQLTEVTKRSNDVVDSRSRAEAFLAKIRSLRDQQ